MVVVRRIEMRGFMAHDDSTVQLPAAGLVVVTGHNGAGKSSLLEAVAAALWNETLRGATPWRTGVPGEALVQTDTIEARMRVVKSGMKRVYCARVGEPDTHTMYDNLTKAQAALRPSVGDFEQWRRTHVFSSQDAAHFTQATDGERKRMLENILGLSRFDGAHTHALIEQRRVDGLLQHAQHAVSIARVVFNHAVADLRRAETAPVEDAPEEPSCPAHEEVAELEAVLETATLAEQTEQARLKELDKALMEARNVAGRASWELAELLKKRDRMDHGACPECEQTLPDTFTQDLASRATELQSAKQKAQAHAEQAQKDAHACLAVLRQLRADQRTLPAQLAELRHAFDTHARWSEARDAWKRRQNDAASRMQKLRQDLAVAEDALTAAEDACDVYSADADAAADVVATLGLRGVRAHLLGQTLGGVEAAANWWLSQIAPAGVSLRLREYTEGKKGALTHAISLAIDGAGGGQGYKGASGGERRRVDAAILLALAEVAAAVTGQACGTVWLDEVFDALDGEGVAAVAAALAQLSADRCVVVITHNADLAAALPAVLRLRAEGGRFV